jgi:hypothetical protein
MRYLILLLSLISTLALADANVGLEWDAVEDERVGVYEVHYGMASGGYTDLVSVVAPDPTATINLPPGEWFFAVKVCKE